MGVIAARLAARSGLLTEKDLRDFYDEDLIKRFGDDTMPKRGTPEWDKWRELKAQEDWYRIGVEQGDCSPERAEAAIAELRAQYLGVSKSTLDGLGEVLADTEIVLAPCAKKKKNWENYSDDETRERKKTWGVSFGKDKDGYFCYTHRARSKSYPTVADIPKSALKFIDSTGMKKVEGKAEVYLGESGLNKSWQAEFPADAKCCRCGGDARIAFVVQETPESDGPSIADLHERNREGNGGLWLHDAGAFATYLCEKCLEPTTLYNQAMKIKATTFTGDMAPLDEAVIDTPQMEALQEKYESGAEMVAEESKATPLSKFLEKIGIGVEINRSRSTDGFAIATYPDGHKVLRVPKGTDVDAPDIARAIWHELGHHFDNAQTYGGHGQMSSRFQWGHYSTPNTKILEANKEYILRGNTGPTLTITYTINGKKYRGIDAVLADPDISEKNKNWAKSREAEHRAKTKAYIEQNIELFAEGFAKFMEDPAKMKAEAPDLYAVFSKAASEHPELKDAGYKIAAAKEKVLNIWDFDGTLIDTGEFHQDRIDNPKPIKKNLDKFKKQIANDEDVVVMTARKNAGLVRSTLEDAGVDMTGIRIVALGTTKNAAKGEYIAKNFAGKYTKIILTDDRQSYLDAAEEAMAERDATFKTVKAGCARTGTVPFFHEKAKALSALVRTNEEYKKAEKAGDVQKCRAMEDATTDRVIKEMEAKSGSLFPATYDNSSGKTVRDPKPRGSDGEFMGGQTTNIVIIPVDCEAVRNEKSVDFCEGGTWVTYAFIPKGEVWLDKTLEPQDMLATLIHELSEIGVMNFGLDYGDAHDIASAVEDTLRQKTKDLNVEATKVVAAMKARATSDEEYMKAVESGDMKKAQAMVDAAAKAEGYTIGPVWHGSGAIFNEFEHRHINTHGSGAGQGFYFTDSKSLASGYFQEGGQLLEGYLRINKTLSLTEKTLSRNDIRKLIMQVDPTGDEIVANYAQETRDYGSPSFYKRELANTVNTIYDGSDNDADMIADISNSGGGKETVLSIAHKIFGYDGYVTKKEDDTIYVVFESNQFKSSATVTRDDNGAVVPLSQRFNPASNDIRARKKMEGMNQYQIVKSDGSVELRWLTATAAADLRKHDGIEFVEAQVMEAQAFTPPSEMRKGEFGNAIDKAIERGVLFYLGWLGGSAVTDSLNKKKAAVEPEAADSIADILSNYDDSKESLDDMDKAEIRHLLNNIGWDATDDGVDFLWAEWRKHHNS